MYRTGITVKPLTLDHLTQPQVPQQEVAPHQNQQNLKVSTVLICAVLSFVKHFTLIADVEYKSLECSKKMASQTLVWLNSPGDPIG